MPYPDPNQSIFFNSPENRLYELKIYRWARISLFPDYDGYQQV